LKALSTSTGDALTVGGGEMGLIDAIGVGLDPLHGRAGVLGQGSGSDLGGGVAGEQLLVGSLALGLVDVASGTVTARIAVGAVLVRGAVGVGGGGTLARP
jgi:hypothetical protein